MEKCFDVYVPFPVLPQEILEYTDHFENGGKRLKQISVFEGKPNNRLVESASYEFRYQLSGNIIEKVNENGFNPRKLTLRYEPSRLQTTFEHNPGWIEAMAIPWKHKNQLKITYDDQGKVIGFSGNTGWATFEYDENGQLKKKTGMDYGEKRIYEYDQHGNVIHEISGGGDSRWEDIWEIEYGNNGRPVHETCLTYNGREDRKQLRRRGERSFTYNKDGRLAQLLSQTYDACSIKNRGWVDLGSYDVSEGKMKTVTVRVFSRTFEDDDQHRYYLSITRRSEINYTSDGFTMVERVTRNSGDSTKVMISAEISSKTEHREIEYRDDSYRVAPYRYSLADAPPTDFERLTPSILKEDVYKFTDNGSDGKLLVSYMERWQGERVTKKTILEYEEIV